MVYCCIMSRNVCYHLYMPYDEFFLFSFLFSFLVSLNMHIFKKTLFLGVELRNRYCKFFHVR